MEKIKETPDHAIKRVVQCSPEQLLELSQRMKAAAMGGAEMHDTVVIDFTDRIALVWTPPVDYLKPRTFEPERRDV